MSKRLADQVADLPQEEEVKETVPPVQQNKQQDGNKEFNWNSRRNRKIQRKENLAQMQAEVNGQQKQSKDDGGFHKDTRLLENDEQANQDRTKFMRELKLDSFEALEKQRDSRNSCPQCQRSRKYYCCECMISVGLNKGDIPNIDLPIKVTVIRHPKEKQSKSSIVPSKVLSPNDVDILRTVDPPQLRPKDDSFDSVVVLFPSEEAVDINQMSEQELKAIKRVVLIDCTWNQTRHYMKQDNIRQLKMVKIQTEKTVFWRYQNGELDTSLATVEALYFFFRDYDVALNCPMRDYSLYKGTYDNLLFFYAWNYKLIQKEYTSGLKAKQNKSFDRIPGYIQKQNQKQENDKSQQEQQKEQNDQ